jgi:hypothetical protein
MQSKVLVFSIAINGYQWLYRNCLASHREFAVKHGYQYQVVTRPYVTTVGVECCWLKLTLMLEALNAGYEQVLFVDADAHINSSAPSLHSVIQPDQYLYLAKSYTQRYNSGVILVQNNVNIRLWLENVIAHRHDNVDQKHTVGWGENGHIIQYTENCKFVATLDRRWNNTYDPELNDYIRHFSFGPLRNNTCLNLSHKLLARLTRFMVKAQTYLNTHKSFIPVSDPLNVLTNKVLKHYTVFSQI